MKDYQETLSFNDFLRGMPPSAFKALGVNQLAYIKAGKGQGFVVHAADGEILLTCETFEHAVRITEDQHLKAVTIH